MPVRYDPVTTAILAREIFDRWGDAQIRSLRMDRACRSVELSFADESRLVALLHPQAGHLLEISPADNSPAGFNYRTIQASVRLGGTEHRFGRLFLSGTHVPVDERTLLLLFSDASGRPREALGLELNTQRMNAFRLSMTNLEKEWSWRINSALLVRRNVNRSLRRGSMYTLPKSIREGLSSVPSKADWIASIEKVEPGAMRMTLLRTWAWTSTLNVDWILGREDGIDLAFAYERYGELVSMVTGAETNQKRRSAWLHARQWGSQPYPHALGDPARPELSGLLVAYSAAAKDEGGLQALLAILPPSEEGVPIDEAAQLSKSLFERLKRLEKRVAALKRELLRASSPDEPRATGQLLLARKNDVIRGASTVKMENFEGAAVKISLDPTLNAVANAERYFDEAKRRDRALERLPSEIRDAEVTRAKIKDALGQLEESGPTGELWKLVAIKTKPPEGRAAATRSDTTLPYTRLMSRGGLEIRVGRGPKDNDDLTFHHSAPNDIWLHASQSPGAHVILRWGRRDENPPRADLRDAAMAAAVHSGARHSGMVTVIWTRRKHVRKRRKSQPGSVVPNRTKTVFVEPDEKRVKSMKPDA